MWIIDFPTLVLIIVAGLYLGLIGVFGWDAAGDLLGVYKNLVFMIIGLSAVWQIFRQRFH
jgi:uncharacterized membrane protein YuzA (DUF378 family)